MTRAYNNARDDAPIRLELGWKNAGAAKAKQSCVVTEYGNMSIGCITQGLGSVGCGSCATLGVSWLENAASAVGVRDANISSLDDW